MFWIMDGGILDTNDNGGGGSGFPSGWTDLGVVDPSNRQSWQGGSAIIGDKLFVIGGFYSGGISGYVSEIDLLTKEVINTTMQPLSDPTVEAVDGNIYTHGGAFGSGSPVDYIYKVDPITKLASNVYRNGHYTETRYRHASVVHDGKLYIQGGQRIANGGAMRDMLVYDPTLNEVVETILGPADMSVRYHHAMAIHGDDIYFHGGQVNSNTRLNDLWKYSITSKIWTRLADAPYAGRAGLSLTTIGNKLYSFGGDSSARGYHADSLLWSYDIATDTWEQITFEGGPSERSHHYAQEYKGSLIIAYGGRYPEGTSSWSAILRNDVWAYTPS